MPTNKQDSWIRRRGWQRCGCGRSACIHQVQNCPLMLANNRGTWLARKIADRRGVPMVAARKPRARVHSLPHDGPFAISRDHERVQIQLEAVADRVVVHDSRLVRASVFPSTPVRSPNCFSSFGVSREWRPRPPQITIPRSKRALIPRFNAPITDVVIPEECQSIPIDTAKRLEPERITQAGQKPRDAGSQDYMLRDRSAQRGHPGCQPGTRPQCNATSAVPERFMCPSSVQIQVR